MGGEKSFKELAQSFRSLQKRDETALLKAIQQSLHIKLDYMANDEFDKGRRNLLNYGHDFGHALESTSGFTVPHGQAVVLGMLLANQVARERGLLDEQIEKEVAETLLIPSLMVKPSAGALDAEAMINAMGKDKKRTGNLLALIMMTDGFNFIRVNDLTPDEVKHALAISQSLL